MVRRPGGAAGRSRARRRGVTLLEVLVASLVLSLGLIGALEVVGRSAAAAREVRDRSRGLMFARSKLEEILKEPLLEVGSDRGQGVDTTTDFDWEAVIEPTSHPTLVSISVAAVHRISGVTVTVSALRRPDLQPPDTGESAETGEAAAGEAAAAGPGGTL